MIADDTPQVNEANEALSLSDATAPAEDYANASPEFDEGRGWLILDVQGVIRFCNTGLARIIGCSPDELVGREVKTILPDLAFRDGTPGYNVALAHLQDTWRDLDLVLADGTQRSMSTRVEHHPGTGGHLFFVELHSQA